jgi:hypothetical protein
MAEKGHSIVVISTESHPRDSHCNMYSLLVMLSVLISLNPSKKLATVDEEWMGH